MLTLFSLPKPFVGNTVVPQRNAIESWRRLHPDCQVVLCGNEAGIVETAREFGLECVPDVARTKSGTPLLDSAFRQVARIARHRFLCFVNADIILGPDLLEAMRLVPFRRYLMVGQRWDLDLNEAIDFAATDWLGRLKRRVSEEGHLHPPVGIDYFVFPNWPPLMEILPLAVGRAGWDNWFLYHARRHGLPLVDATQRVFVVHQNHDYRHVPQGRNFYEGPETDENLRLIGGPQRVFTLEDATHRLTPAGLRPIGIGQVWRRRWRTFGVLHPRLAMPVLGVRFLLAIARSVLRKIGMGR